VSKLSWKCHKAETTAFFEYPSCFGVYKKLSHQWEANMRRTVLAAAILVGAATVVPATYANAQDFHAKFSGFNEIGGLGAGETGAIFSPGQGTLKLKLDKKLQTVNWTLTYSDLSAPVTQAHIHLGKVHVAGGIMVFFCSNLASPPPGTQLCPNSGTISGMFTGGSVIGPVAQHVTIGDFNALAQAILTKTAYANIHTTNFPAGEIRGQVHRDDDEDHHDK
jgi:CHRD domain